MGSYDGSSCVAVTDKKVCFRIDRDADIGRTMLPVGLRRFSTACLIYRACMRLPTKDWEQFAWYSIRAELGRRLRHRRDHIEKPNRGCASQRRDTGGSHGVERSKGAAAVPVHSMVAAERLQRTISGDFYPLAEKASSQNKGAGKGCLPDYIVVPGLRVYR
jgi:hypothetical protein